MLGSRGFSLSPLAQRRLSWAQLPPSELHPGGAAPHPLLGKARNAGLAGSGLGALPSAVPWEPALSVTAPGKRESGLAGVSVLLSCSLVHCSLAWPYSGLALQSTLPKVCRAVLWPFAPAFGSTALNLPGKFVVFQTVWLWQGRGR